MGLNSTSAVALIVVGAANVVLEFSTTDEEELRRRRTSNKRTKAKDGTALLSRVLGTDNYALITSLHLPGTRDVR